MGILSKDQPRQERPDGRHRDDVRANTGHEGDPESWNTSDEWLPTRIEKMNSCHGSQFCDLERWLSCSALAGEPAQNIRSCFWIKHNSPVTTDATKTFEGK